MDYYNTYTLLYEENYKFEENFIKKELIEYANQNLAFTFACNTISEILLDKCSNNIISTNNTLNILFSFFKTSMSKYSKDHLKSSFEKDTYTKYNSLDQNDLPLGYSFKNFIKDLAYFMSINEINRLFSNNSSLFQMMYTLNDFKNFEIRTYNIDLEDTPNYISLRQTLYPVLEQSLTTKIESTKTVIDADALKLGNKEKSFLFYVMCKALSENSSKKSSNIENNDKLFNLPATELCRLITIIDIKDSNSFDKKKYRDSETYKIITKGIEHIEKEDRINFIQTLLINIKELNLSETTKYIKTILNKEHNKLTKHQKVTK